MRARPIGSPARRPSRARGFARAIFPARTIFLTPSCSQGRTLKTGPEIERLFEEAGVDLTKPVVASCGSGITASVLALGLAEIGHRKAAVYDGSWSEWGADQSLPIETG